MSRSLPRRLAIVLPLLSPAACAEPSGHIPSLQPRPIEQMSLNEPEAPPPIPAQVADPQALAAFAPALDRARAADAAFRQALETARPALARGRGAASGSNDWVEAQTALSRVETARDPLHQVLTDLDAARNAPPTQANTGQLIAAEQVYRQVAAIDAEEDKALRAVWAR